MQNHFTLRDHKRWVEALVHTDPERGLRAQHHVEISIRGQWTQVPALLVHGHTLVVTGSLMRIAAVHDEEWMDTEFADPEACLQALRSLGLETRPDIFTFTQRVTHTTPAHGFPMEWDSWAVANVASFEEWWNALPRETRKNVRRAHKRGVRVSVQPFDDELVRGIAGIQNESAIRQGRRYQHYGKTFELVKRDHFGFAERSDFICAHFENELIGFLKLVYRGDVASIMQLNSKIAHFDKRPANALLAQAVELCATRGVRSLTYGMFNYGNKDQSSLREFKIRNGFGNVLVPRYYVPLTTWGKLCVRGKLYRGLHEVLPGSVIQTALRARAAWYDLTHKTSESEH